MHHCIDARSATLVLNDALMELICHYRVCITVVFWYKDVCNCTSLDALHS